MIHQSVKDFYFQAARYLSVPSSLLAAARFRLRQPKNPEGFYVHLGCGFKYLDGLINVDGNVFRRIDLWHDLRNRLPFPDKSCAFVYTSHTIEHMFPDEAIRLLSDVKRVLHEGGVVRVAVPSMEYALEIAAGKHVEDWPRPFADPVAQSINYLFCDGQHKYAYNFAVLDTFARAAGFTEVVNYSAEHGVAQQRYGAVEVGDEPVGSLVVELRA